MATNPSELPVAYYSFEEYVTRHRMLTYWYQIKELLNVCPKKVLEIGAGSGMVAAYLTSLGISLETLDINPGLNPTHVGSVLDLSKVVGLRQYDLILCARVLHHLPFEKFGEILDELHKVMLDGGHLILTLPREDFSLYFMFRYTSSPIRTWRIPLPLFIKRVFLWKNTRSGLWKINDSQEHSLSLLRDKIISRFKILNEYCVPEDSAHYLLVLQKETKR